MLSLSQTIWLYLAIFVTSTFLAFKSQRVLLIKGKKVCSFRITPFIFSFLIPWFFISFTNIGSDYVSYSMIAANVDMQNYMSYLDSEPGMNLTFIVLKTICGSIDITLFILKSITIIIAFFSIYIAKDHIRIGYSVLAYLLLFYLPSFYLLSISIASVIVSLAISLYTFRDKLFLPIALILFAAQLHNACYIFFPAFLACVYINKWSKNSKSSKILAIVAFSIVAYFSSMIFDFARSNVEGFHYEFERSYVGSGYLLFILYIPLFYIVYIINFLNNDKKINSMLLVFALASCLFRIMAYSFEVIERMEIVLTPLYSMLIPSVIYSTDSFKKTKKGNGNIVMLIYFIYLLFRGFLVVLERTTSSSGVGNYVFFNPFG